MLVVVSLGLPVLADMPCDSPQFLLHGGVTDCGLCLSCCKLKDNAERQRRFYWLKRKRGHVHA